MTRREALASTGMAALAQKAASPQSRAPIVNGAEHAWVVRDPRFPIDLQLAVCPKTVPQYDYSAEYLLSEMKT